MISAIGLLPVGQASQAVRQSELLQSAQRGIGLGLSDFAVSLSCEDTSDHRPEYDWSYNGQEDGQGNNAVPEPLQWQPEGNCTEQMHNAAGSDSGGSESDDPIAGCAHPTQEQHEKR
jgi:hypothetical protein